MSKLRHLGILILLAGLLATGCSSEVKIGAVVSQSGAVAPYGERVRNGLDLALAEVNAAGGFQGGKVELIYKDDATNPERGRQVVEELINTDGVRAIIGAISSTVTLAIAPICERNRVILLSPSASAPEITSAGDYIYRNYPSDIVEGTAMAKFARDLGLERVAVFAIDNDFGAGLKHVFTQQYEGRFRQIVNTTDFEEGSVERFPAMVAEIKKLNPDGVYIVAYVDDTATLLEAILAAGLKSIKMGSASVTDTLAKQAGGASENFVYPQPNFDVDSSEPAVAAFVKAYRDRFNEDPDIFAAHGYDALKILVLAMETGGSAHPNDIKLGLRSIKEYDGAAGKTMFDANGDVVRYPRIFIIRGGQTMPYEQFVDEGGSLFAGS